MRSRDSKQQICKIRPAESSYPTLQEFNTIFASKSVWESNQALSWFSWVSDLPGNGKIQLVTLKIFFIHTPVKQKHFLYWLFDFPHHWFFLFFSSFVSDLRELHRLIWLWSWRRGLSEGLWCVEDGALTQPREEHLFNGSRWEVAEALPLWVCRNAEREAGWGTTTVTAASSQFPGRPILGASGCNMG